MEEKLEAVDRLGTESIKWDEAIARSGNVVIPLSTADMDFAAPQAVIDAVVKRAMQGTFGYTYLPASYYRAVRDWSLQRHGWSLDTEQILYVPRVVEALPLLLAELTAPGDGVLMHTPSYGPLTNLIEPNGRRLVTSELQLVNGQYEIDFSETEYLLANEAKVLLLCSPHNPTGRVWSREELSTLVTLAERHNALIISDEVHADIVHAGHRHVPIASLGDEASRRTITMMSPAKTFNLAGLEVANAIVTDTGLRERLRSALDRGGFHNPSYFAAVALESAYSQGQTWLAAILELVSANLVALRNHLEAHMPLIRLIEPDGTYLAWLDCRDWSADESDLIQWTVHEARVHLSPGSSFGRQFEGFMRINLAVPEDVLLEALWRLSKSFSSITQKGQSHG